MYNKNSKIQFEHISYGKNENFQLESLMLEEGERWKSLKMKFYRITPMSMKSDIVWSIRGHVLVSLFNFGAGET